MIGREVGKRANGEGSLYQDKKSGRWVWEREESGKRIRVTGRTQAECLRRKAERLAQHQQGLHRNGSRSTVLEVLNHWFETNERNWRYSTRVGYRASIDTHLQPLARIKVQHLTTAQIDKWQNDLLRSRKRSTVHQARVVLRQALEMAVSHSLIARNPMSGTGRVPKPKPRHSVLTLDEASRLVQRTEDPVMSAAILLAVTLGLRRGEVLGLRWMDVEEMDGMHILHVRRQLQRQTGKGLCEEAPKSRDSVREIVLDAPHVAALQRLRAHQAEMRLASGGQYNPDGYLVCTDKGTPMDPSNFRRRWARALNQAGVSSIKVHEARHTAATLMLLEGAQMFEVQKVLGHADISLTINTYSHVTSREASSASHAVTRALYAG